MVFKIVVSLLAEREIDAAIAFYESRKPRLGKQFSIYLKGYIEFLKTNPELFAIKKEPSFRELPFKRFPFVIIYEILQNEVIICSVFHTHRNATNKP